MSKIKNIAILVTIVVVLVLSYIFFIKPSTDTTNLFSATPVSTPDMLARAGDSTVARDFLTLLLNVKNIKLDDTIFSDKAFTSLRDSSITLTTDGTEGTHADRCGGIAELSPGRDGYRRGSGAPPGGAGRAVWSRGAEG